MQSLNNNRWFRGKKLASYREIWYVACSEKESGHINLGDPKQNSELLIWDSGIRISQI